MVDGIWEKDTILKKTEKGGFIRKPTSFRSWITPDGSKGITGDAGYQAEKGRYHLYISLACPWAHRTLIFRKLKGLEDIISLSIVSSFMGEDGWNFHEGDEVIPDSINGVTYLYEIYKIALSDYTGRVSVPVLWDKKTKTIVNNESSEIIRMFNSAFDGIGAHPEDYFPVELRSDIDSINELIYSNVNNGVYRAGFASTQEAYLEAVNNLFVVLDQLEDRLAKNRYLLGDSITEADWRLFTTLIRFDAVYVGHFKCNRRRIIDYPNLYSYLRELYQIPGIAETVKIDHIKNHYYQSHESINPTRIVPKGPILDFSAPHNREHLK